MDKANELYRNDKVIPKPYVEKIKVITKLPNSEQSYKESQNS